MRVQKTPFRYYQLEFNNTRITCTVKDSTGITSELSTNTVLPKRIQVELSRCYQWKSNKHCPVTILQKPSSECAEKHCPGITSEYSAKAVQVKIPQTLSRYHQWIFNWSCQGITSAKYTNIVQISLENIPETLSSYHQWMFSKSVQVSPVQSTQTLSRYYQW